MKIFIMAFEIALAGLRETWEFILFLADEFPGWFCFFICGVAITILVLASIESEKRWQEFVKERNCEIVAKVDGGVIPVTTIGTNGQIAVSPIIEPDKVGWKCDDGVTYWR